MCKKLIYFVSFALVLGVALTSAVEAADPSLVGWWTFDEGSGVTAYDSSGNENHGTLLGDPQWVAGNIGGAIEMDGSGDHIEVPDSPSLSISDAVTVSMWVYPTSSGNFQLIEKGGTGGQAWGNAYAIRVSNLTIQFHNHPGQRPVEEVDIIYHAVPPIPAGPVSIGAYEQRRGDNVKWVFISVLRVQHSVNVDLLVVSFSA